MKRFLTVMLGIPLVAIAIIAAVLYLPKLADFLSGVQPVIVPPGQDITRLLPPAVNHTNLPLSLPDGFSIEVFAKDLSGARAMVFDGTGNLWVSQTSEGTISMLELRDGRVADQQVVFRNLRRPHGLALDPQNPLLLYIAEEDKVSRVQLYSDGPLEKLVDLPAGAGHFTRTIGFGPDDRLYISIGSSCNVCVESDSRRAKIFSMNKDGGNFREYASGLRNAVFFAWSYVDGRMWVTEMGRDHLGDDLPPDEINIIEEGRDYGWPVCYGKNVPDPFGPGNCTAKTASHIDLQAHSAPLGLGFVPEEGWPEEYWYDLLVAFHGSWNRSAPTGYKLVRIKLDAAGNYQGTEDFITGWLQGRSALGRPVAVLIQPGGVMYVSDDHAGVIYRITYQSEVIEVLSPQPDELVSSPLPVTGRARGFWFFEADFPVRLLDANGRELGVGIAQAQGEWMTEEFVPFEAEIDFDAPDTDTGILVLEKANPSGLPEHAAQLSIPIRFR